MKHTLLLILFAIITYNVNAQDTAVVKNEVTIMLNAMLRNDMGPLADFTHPRIIASMGGSEKAILAMNIGKIGEFYSKENKVYCVIPHDITLNTEDGYFSSNSSILGISQDQGKTWKFVSAGNIGHNKLKILFPELPDGLEVLPQTVPVFHKKVP